MRVSLRYNKRHLGLDVRQEGELFRVTDDTSDKTVRTVFLDETALLIEVDGKVHRVDVVRNGTSFHVAVGADTFTFVEERASSTDPQLSSVAAPEIVAPMPGKVVRVFVKPGDQVASGDTLFILEAMKMENRLTADASGVVTSVTVGAGDLVAGGQVLAVLSYVADDEAS